MSKIVIWLINQYQKFLSPDTGIIRFKNPVCVFYPTCSQYSKEAFIKYNFFKATHLSVKRILRCHPRQKEHFDPLP